jgi:uncharacterized protein CbrC (UPF0167 family)
VDDYTRYPGGEKFEPWQDHEWPPHCGSPAEYIGEVGERELTAMSGGQAEEFLLAHEVFGGELPITLDMVPPHAPAEGEAWESTIHHFRCVVCGWDMLLWDAS